jgi:MFS family permease
LTFGLLVLQGLGAGLTANPWQTMIGKIIPRERRSTFFGAQAAAANLLASVSAFLAGVILSQNNASQGFVLCFLLCFSSMMISWIFLGLTREPSTPPEPIAAEAPGFWTNMGNILKRDRNFRWFLVARMISQLAIMGFAFYTVYAVRVHGASELTVGGMTSVLLGAQIAGNVLMGWVGDRWSRKGVMEIGLGAAALSALLAWWAPSVGWFYLVFALAAIANVAVWTIGIAMSLEFGDEADRPAYIGMANTLVAPANILAPFLGGWLADLAGYPAAFIVSAAGALAALWVFQSFVVEKHIQPHSPRLEAELNTPTPPQAPGT